MAKIPEKAGKFKILDQIGKGGMGVVYTAMHPSLKRKVILKKLTIRDKEFRERFRLEADVMMDLRSDYIVDMYDHFREGSSWYIAMEYIEGITLEELIQKEGILDFDLVIYIILSVAKALEYVHKRGIVHRDIKPSNVYISRKGEVKLGDFGIASSGRNVDISDPGSAMGTPAYMAPEQFEDSSKAGREADMFSLGISLYETLTGNKPFQSDNYDALKEEIKKGRYTAPIRLRKGAPFLLYWLIFRTLIPHKRFRLSSAESVRRKLERQLGSKGLLKSKEKLVQLLSNNKKSHGKSQQTVFKGKREEKKKISIPLLIMPFMLVALALILFLFFRTQYGAFEIRVVPFERGSEYTIFKGRENPVKKGFLNESGEKKIFLPEGSYRVQVESGSSIFFRTFYLPPRGESKDGVSLTLLSTPLESLPLTMDITILDRFTGEALTNAYSIKLLNDEKWVDYTDEIARDLKTGSPVSLKISAEGYREEFYEFSPGYEQTTVNLQILMRPVAAQLQIESFEGDRFFINGSERYFSLETEKFETVKFHDNKEQILHLIPGNYTLQMGFENDLEERKISLQSGKLYKVP